MATTRLTDEAVRRLRPAEEAGQYIVRDADLPGFFLVVGRRAKTFTVQYDIRELGGRSTRRRSIGRFGQVSAREARAAAMRLLGSRDDAPADTRGPTLREAWGRYPGRTQAQ